MSRFMGWLLNDPSFVAAIKKEVTRSARSVWGDQLVVDDGLPYGLEMKPGVITPFREMSTTDPRQRALEAVYPDARTGDRSRNDA